MSIETLDGLPPHHTPLWRYIKFSTLLLLLEGKAYFPSVAKLSATDPLEGRLRIDPIQLNGRLSQLAEPNNSKHLNEWLFEGAAPWQQRLQHLKQIGAGVEHELVCSPVHRRAAEAPRRLVLI